MPPTLQPLKIVAAAMVTAAVVAGGFVVTQQDGDVLTKADKVRFATPADDAEAPADEDQPAAAPGSTSALGTIVSTKKEQKLATRAMKRAKLLARLAERKVVLPAEFDLATFNILGAMHTGPGADAQQYADWRIRAEWTAQYIQSRGLDIVGLQEVEPHQYSALMAATGNQFDGWPANYMRGVHNRAIMTTMIWRTADWTALEKDYLTIPFMDWRNEIPVVKLRNNHSGAEIWVINTHNAPRSLQGQRDQATAIEIAKINELVATGLPVFFVGDMNERNPIFSRVTSQTALTTPNGGQSGRIDYIFGPKDAAYSEFAVERPALITQITDHNVVRVHVKVGG